MIKKLSFTLLCAASLFSTSVFSKGEEYTVLLKPGTPEVIKNFTVWELKGPCNISTNGSQIPVSITMLFGEGSLNHEKMKKGDYKLLTVNNGESFYLTAKAQARVQLLNDGSTDVSVKCISD